VGIVLAVACWAASAYTCSGGVTRQGVLLTDLQSGMLEGTWFESQQLNHDGVYLLPFLPWEGVKVIRNAAELSQSSPSSGSVYRDGSSPLKNESHQR